MSPDRDPGSRDAAHPPRGDLVPRLLGALRDGTAPRNNPAGIEGRLAYHVEEYRLQRAAGAGDGLLGREGLVRGRVLDVGCGLGQFLITTGQAGQAQILAGVDLDHDMLRCGAHLARWTEGLRLRPAFAAGDALRLPFPDRTFDLVVCRVVLMSLPVVPALLELARMVRPGGHLYLHLTGWGYYFADVLRRPNAGSVFALLNGTLLHCTGRQLRIRGLWNNFETPARVMRILRAQGLAIEKVAPGPHRLGAPLNSKVLARRPGADA